MSWAAHNPELWQKLCAEGIATKIATRQVYTSIEIVEKIINLDNSADPDDAALWDALCDWASKEIVEAESGHFADAADRAHESEIERQLHKEEV